MTASESKVSEAPLKKTAVEKPIRRVGTFTFGIVLVLSGLAMMASLFSPALDLTVMVKLSPLALVSLGVETLLSARTGGRIKYDWMGMILCCMIVCTALVCYGVAWCMLYQPGWIYF